LKIILNRFRQIGEGIKKMPKGQHKTIKGGDAFMFGLYCNTNINKIFDSHRHRELWKRIHFKDCQICREQCENQRVPNVLPTVLVREQPLRQLMTNIYYE
jgi:uncharacterized protein YjaZ